MQHRYSLLLAGLISAGVAQAATPVGELEIRYLPMGAMISWENADDQIASFTIERSADGFTFELLERVEAEDLESYNYLDTDRPGEKLFYRVTSVDHAGSTAVSDLAEAATEHRPSWNLAADHTADIKVVFDFEVEAASHGMLACDLYDFLGNPISHQELMVQPGPNQLSVSTAELRAGAYRLNVDGASLSEEIHFVKAPNEEHIAPSTFARGN